MSQSLYERLGEKAGITRIVDDVIDAHFKNETVKTRYENVKDIERTRQMSVEFFIAGSGGPGEYTGMDMLSRHKGMNISEEEFIAVVDDVLYALDKNSIDEATRKDVLAILYSLKGEIIRV